MINIPYKDLDNSSSELHPALQFLLILATLLVALLIGTAIGLGIITGLYGYSTFTAITESNLVVPHAIPALWILQLTSTTLPILAAALFFAYVVTPKPQQYIRSNFKFSWILMLLVFAIMFISSPIIEFLSNINAKMVLPHFLQWMRESEDNAEKLTNAMLHMDTIGQLIFDLLFIGLFTAVVEEFLFRGCIQTIIEKWTKNVHVAIWITAILFSAFHMEFFGFLPRMMLGVLFGYFVAWSGSIWTSVWGHFINNGTAVVITYLYQHKEISISPDDQHVFNSAGYIISFIIVLFLFWVYRDIALKKKPVQA